MTTLNEGLKPMSYRDFDAQLEKKGFIVKIGWSASLMMLVSVMGFIAFTFWLYSDRHNDGRYVSLDAYKVDHDLITNKLDDLGRKQDFIVSLLLKKTER